MNIRKLLVILMVLFTCLSTVSAGGSKETEVTEETEAQIETTQDIISEGLGYVDDGADWAVNSSINLVTSAIGSVLDEIYLSFHQAFTLSFTNVKDLILPKLLAMLLLVEISYIAVMAIVQQELAFSQFMKKFFVLMLIVIIANNMDLIVQGLSVMFSTMGFVAGDSSYQGVFIVDSPLGMIFMPSDILDAVKQMLAPLWTLKELIDDYKDVLITNARGIMGTITAIIAYVPLMAQSALIYFVMLFLLFVISFCALNIAFWLIEFSFLMVIATLCLPWQIFDPAKFVSSGIWQALFGQAIKILCVVLIVAIAPGLFNNAVFTSNLISMGETISDGGGVPMTAIFMQIVVTGLTVGAYCYFLMKGPAIAKAIVVGQPTMETLGTHMIAKVAAGVVTAGAALPFAAGAASIREILGRIFHPNDGVNPGAGGSSSEAGAKESKDTNPDKFAGGDKTPPKQPETQDPSSDQTQPSLPEAPSTPQEQPSDGGSK